MLKAIIFDMDGVIADTEPGYKIATDEFLREQGIITADDYQDQFIGITNEAMWTTIINDFQLPFTIDECVDAINQKRALMEKENGLHPLPNILGLIRRFHDANLHLAIASSSPMSEIDRIVDLFAIRQYFSAFITGTECENSKPDPEVFFRAAKALQVKPEECLVIEDSNNGLLAAKRAGMKAIGFANPLFGNQDLSTATIVVSSFTDVTTEMCYQLMQD
ncbi:MAG: HAD-IA family hydrolase [Lachnospiraceae bacterium]|nr:HAD-IA family hydrolase [Lachnospiraceae bacterium]